MPTETATNLNLTFKPGIPYDPEQLGVPFSMVVDLFVRRLYSEGTSSYTSMRRGLKLSHPIVEAVFRHLQKQQLVDIRGIVGEEYSFSLTNAGRQLAEGRLKISEYAGAVPVSLSDYKKACSLQRARVKINREQLRQALSDLVLPDEIISQLGPALVSQDSLFLYGPTGNGKTSLAERLLRAYSDYILIPYAVEVDNQVILVYDPVVHRKAEVELDGVDGRWVLCHRPCVTVGGELMPEMLELRHDVTAKIYAAPLQMKANNGILVIDDFGRQVMQPRELLNRWIVPLDRRVDYLNLHYGVKFEIPFEMMVVFSTNMDPHELAEEAFLRRIHNKVFVSDVSPQIFDEIFSRVCEGRRLPVPADLAPQTRKICGDLGYGALRACYPDDLVDIVVSICEFEERPVVLDRESMKQAAQLYFARK